MRTILTLAAVIGLAGTANAATTTTMHHRHTMTHTNPAQAGSGSAAVRELNEKSLQQASTGTMAQPMGGAAGSPTMGSQTPMSDSGSQAATPGMSGAPAGDPSMATPPVDGAAAPTPPQ